MRVIISCQIPFQLTHGGLPIQIEQTLGALQRIGVAAEPLRWWDDTQAGDVFHHFGRLPVHLLHLARQKGMRVVLSDLLTEQGSRSRNRLRAQKWTMRLLAAALPERLTTWFMWDAYRLADACIALTAHEAELLHYLFRAPRERLRVVPNGVDAPFLTGEPATRGPWLVCTAAITERKRVVELAQAAITGCTPVWIVGQSYSEADPYARKFMDLARANPQWVRYEGPVNDRTRLARIYREARGFVLLSTMESLSLSALEAAACGCPLLLSDLPWGRTVFKGDASYCPITDRPDLAAVRLKAFYEAAPRHPVPPRPLSWEEVARQLKGVYETVLGRPRPE